MIFKKDVSGLHKIYRLERESDRLFGTWRKSRFIFDSTKVPELVVPDLANFEVIIIANTQLKPYVSVHTPRV